MLLEATVSTLLSSGKNMGYSLLFLLLPQILVCFINVMVICFPLLLWTLCFPTWREAQRRPIDLSGSRDPMPLSQFLPCLSFYKCWWRRVAAGELPQTLCLKQKAGNEPVPPAEQPNPCAPHDQLVFHYACIYAVVNIYISNWHKTLVDKHVAELAWLNKTLICYLLCHIF